MILEKQTNNLVLEEGDSKGSIGMSLDLESANVLMQMLSKNLYSDAIGSTIRECASNALDSHRRCNIDNPIIVKLERTDAGNYEFSVEDFGCGLDADDVKDIISKYGKSTKRSSVDELGMMGLGFKSPLAYSSSFYFVCRKNGVERKYMMYEGEDENTIDLLFETKTKQSNGVKIIVPVNYYDRTSFVNKTREQLAYFENVYFDVSDGYNKIENTFVIHRGEHFQYSELSSDRNMHLCLDNVYYPIDFDKLGIPPIKFPVGLRFSLTDGIFPVPSRESIRYTKEAKETILKRIGQVADYFVEKYNSTIKETDDVYSIYNYYSNNNRQVDIINEGAAGSRITADVECLTKYANIRIIAPTLKGIAKFPLSRLTEINYYMLGEYTKHYKLSNGRLSEIKYKEHLSLHDTRNHSIYIAHEKITALKKDYVKSVSGNSNICFIRKSKEFKLGKPKGATDYSTYMDLLQLKKYPKEEWRALIKEFQYIISLVTKGFVDLDKVVIPQSFIDGRKKIKEVVVKERRIKLEGEIVGKRCESLERYVEGKSSKLVQNIQNMAEIHRNKNVSIYSGLEDVGMMDKLFTVFNWDRVQFITFSERELKKIKEIKLHNWIELNEFMKGENKLFKRVVTAQLIYQLMRQNTNVFNRIETIEKLSSSLGEKLSQLKDYQKEWYTTGDSTIYTAMLEIANNNNLFDESIYSLYKEIKNLLEKLKFLNPLLGGLSSYGGIKEEHIIDAISDLFKYYKQKLNLDRYKLAMNDEIIPSDSITEEEVEELTEQI